MIKSKNLVPNGKSMNTAIAEFMDMFDAELSINMPDRAVPGSVKDRARAQVATVRAAGQFGEDVDNITPYEWPEGNSLICVVWPNPVPRTARHRVALRSWMLQSGVQLGEIGHIWAYPRVSAIQPLEVQIDQYRDVTLNAMKTMGAPYVMLVGGIVTNMWRKELKLRQVQGHLGIWNEFFVWPILNPIQCIPDPQMIGPIRESVVNGCMVVRDGAERALGHLHPWCHAEDCSAGAWSYDRDGLGWCKLHIDKAVQRREDMLKARKRRILGLDQEKLL